MPFECLDDIMGRRIKKGNSKAGDDCGQRKNCDKGDERVCRTKVVASE
jgi:hypothetical protein